MIPTGTMVSDGITVLDGTMALPMIIGDGDNLEGGIGGIDLDLDSLLLLAEVSDGVTLGMIHSSIHSCLQEQEVPGE